MADLHAKRMQWLMMRNRQGFAQLFSGHKDTHNFYGSHLDVCCAVAVAATATTARFCIVAALERS